MWKFSKLYHLLPSSFRRTISAAFGAGNSRSFQDIITDSKWCTVQFLMIFVIRDVNSVVQFLGWNIVA